jgi:hypothetical protein
MPELMSGPYILTRDLTMVIDDGSPACGEFYTISCTQPVRFAPPWEGVQIHSYDTTVSGDTVVTTLMEYSYDCKRFFELTHAYSPGSASVTVNGMTQDAIPARWLGDGFTPWAMLKHDILTLHSSSVLLEDGTLVVFLGYHDCGKSTAASYLASQPGNRLVSDDSLLVQTSEEGVFACASFWDEACKQDPVQSRDIRIALLDDNSGEFRRFGPVMALTQFAGGVYCSEFCFDYGTSLVQALLETADFAVLPYHPDQKLLDKTFT